MTLVHRTLIGLVALSYAVACGSSSENDDGSSQPGGSGGSGTTTGTGGSGSGGKGGGGGGSLGPALSELPALYADAGCEAYMNCAGLLFDFFLPGEECEPKVEAQFEEEIPRLQEAVDAGRVRYDPSKMQACLDEFRSKSCEELNDRQTEACEQALDGTVALGEECTMNAECEGPTYCKVEDACPGTCANLELAGELCSDDDQCASGLVCSDATGRCVAPAGEGDQCQGGEPDCALGFLCTDPDDDDTTPGTCRAYSDILANDVDDPCTIGTLELCRAGLVCEVDTLAGPTFVCAEKVGSGEACRIAFPDECPADEFCSIPTGMLDGTCEPRPVAGEPCARGPLDPANAPSVCAPNTRCDGGNCRDFAELGESCQTDAVCLSEHCEGGACISDTSCE